MTLFGTDGLRGRVNTPPMTAEVCLALGRAVAARATDGGHLDRPARVAVGCDTRASCELFDAALTAGLLSMGAEVLRLGVLPTPGVAHLTRALEADAGLMISASHNPHFDNGVKVFGGDGFKASDEEEAALERLCSSEAGGELRLANPGRIGRTRPIPDAPEQYIAHLRASLPEGARFEGLRIGLDCAHGAAYRVGPALFEGLGARVVPLGVEPDGININEGVGALHPEAAAALVHAGKADVAVALDGDADRVIVIDERGDVVDGDAILAILALDRQATGTLPGAAVVATVMSNVGLEIGLRTHGIALIRTGVGDRQVVQAMRRQGLLLGGEQSGHMICLDHATTGDGLLTALSVLECRARAQRSLADLRTVFRRVPQTLVNVEVSDKRPLDDWPGLRAEIRAAEQALGEAGRVLVRYSGTEPKARIMIEGERADEVERWADRLAAVLRSVSRTEEVGP